MIVYSQDRACVNWRASAEHLLGNVDRARRDRTRTSFQELLIDFGEFESGLVDAWSPREDCMDDFCHSLRKAGLSTGRLLYRSWRDIGLAFETELDAIETTIRNLEAYHPPEEIPRPVSEGYAFYGLFPESYLVAAEKAIRADTAAVVCIGIRSIGTGLSSAVAAVAEHFGAAVKSCTLRPRGHPWQRTLQLSFEFENLLRNIGGAAFWVVDEGPGLSGSSFGCVINRLLTLGVARERIVVFPSWPAAEERLLCEEARQAWSCCEKSVATFEDVWIDSGRLAAAFRCTSMTDISAGNWRQRLYASEAAYPAVNPQHEARKYICAVRGSRSKHLLKFEGLGSYSRAKLLRAQKLADNGFSPRITGFGNGFLMSEFVPGEPLELADADGPTLQTLARYLAAIRCLFPCPACASWTALMNMIQINVEEDLGQEFLPEIAGLESYRPEISQSQTTAIDGRMLPHEWIRTASGLLKTDALDHHRDHFFPGCQDIAWDLAAAIVEFRMDQDQSDYFLDRYQDYSPDRTLKFRLNFYLCAYLAFRLGYVKMCAQTMAPSPDRERFGALLRRYRMALRRAIRQAGNSNQ